MNLRSNMMHRKNLWTIVVLAIILCAVILFPSCKGTNEERVYSQSVKITTEQTGVNGILIIIESYRDSDLVISMFFIDGDGDGIIDGKSGPKEQGQWPKGWGWFDDLYNDVIVSQSSVLLTDDKITLKNGQAHELRLGEYQSGQITLTN